MAIDTEIVLRLILAVIAGGIVGFERKKVHKPAGLRTHMLVCMGAALFMIVAISAFPDESGRIMAGIATGIGFLGAGTIFRAEDRVKGLTTAASIWTVAAIGLTIGLGEYALGATATVLVIIILQLNKIKFLREV
tara:strand:- start:3215 stop:3619 length:405 start_codon:yes stop_codon:yes gene_type:complete